MTEYTHDDRLNDFYLLEAVIGDKERPEGGRVDQACNRLEESLLNQNNTQPAPTICQNCLFLCWPDQTCANAESPDRLTPQHNPVSCGLWIPLQRRMFQ